MAKSAGEIVLPAVKRFKRIPVYVVEEHNDALQYIYLAIGGRKLPLEGTTLVHFDAHPDMLIDRKLKGADARAGRKLLPLLQIENWIVPAAAAGHIGRVVWLRPPWAKQMADGTRTIRVGDQPDTGFLRVASKEPYFMSDALFARDLINERTFTLTVAELSDPSFSSEAPQEDMPELADRLDVSQPYVLDIDLDFFSTGNPFLALYEGIGLYDQLESIFGFDVPASDEDAAVEKVVESRERQLRELESLFQHLEDHGTLDNYSGEHTELFKKVSSLSEKVIAEAKRSDNDTPDWYAVFAAGCTRDQGGLPHHISSEDEIRSMVNNVLAPLLRNLPPPILITVARSTDDGYCPPEQVELIQSLVLHTLKETFATADPALHYLTVNTF